MKEIRILLALFFIFIDVRLSYASDDEEIAAEEASALLSRLTPQDLDECEELAFTMPYYAEGQFTEGMRLYQQMQQTDRHPDFLKACLLIQNAADQGFKLAEVMMDHIKAIHKSAFEDTYGENEGKEVERDGEKGEKELRTGCSSFEDFFQKNGYNSPSSSSKRLAVTEIEGAGATFIDDPCIVGHGGQQYESSLFIFSSRTQNNLESGKNWDNTRAFARELDESLFKIKQSKRVIGVQILFGLLGCIPSNALTGLLMADTAGHLPFAVPVSGKLSDFFVSWIVVTTTPALVKQFVDIGYNISQPLFGEKKFKTVRNRGHTQDLLPEKAGLHYAINFLVPLCAGMYALDPTFQLFNAEEKRHLNFFIATAGPFFIFHAGNQIRVGVEFFNDQFIRHYYTGNNTNYSQRMILLDRIKLFKKFIVDPKNRKFVDFVYNEIYAPLKRENTSAQGDEESLINADEAQTFLASCLVVKNIARLGYNIGAKTWSREQRHLSYGERIIEIDRLLETSKFGNFKKNLDDCNEFQGQIPFRKKLVSNSTTLLMGLGLFGKYFILENGLNAILISPLGVDPSYAFYASQALAGGLTLFITTIQFDKQQEFYQRLCGWFSLSSVDLQRPLYKRFLDNFTVPSVDLRSLRFIVDSLSHVNGFIFALPTWYAGIKALEDVPASFAVPCVAAATMLDFSFYTSFFRTCYNGIVTGIVKLLPTSWHRNEHIKVAVINAHAEDLENYVKVADDSAIEILADKTQQNKQKEN